MTMSIIISVWGFLFFSFFISKVTPVMESFDSMSRIVGRSLIKTSLNNLTHCDTVNDTPDSSHNSGIRHGQRPWEKNNMATLPVYSGSAGFDPFKCPCEEKKGDLTMLPEPFGPETLGERLFMVEFVRLLGFPRHHRGRRHWPVEEYFDHVTICSTIQRVESCHLWIKAQSQEKATRLEVQGKLYATPSCDVFPMYRLQHDGRLDTHWTRARSLYPFKTPSTRQSYHDVGHEVEDIQEEAGGKTTRRQLQDVLDTLPAVVSDTFNYKQMKKRKNSHLHCDDKTPCFEGYGICRNHTCTGFVPDLKDEHIIQCVVGYICKIKPGQLQGAHINEDFQVIAVNVNESCGQQEPLSPTKSIFGNTNRWQCDSTDDEDDSCTFVAGVGYKLNATSTVEKVRLCGCPGVDKQGVGKVCHSKRDFFVPLALLSIQECLRNAHCVDLGFAQCDQDHCVRGAAVAATAGLKVLQCLTSQNCRLKDLGAQAMEESMKLIPIASSHDCGASRALDPDALSDSALPCVVKASPEGRCEVNLGLKSFGSSRLCGCLGDPGGNGRNCDQVEDFTDEMALVDMGECSTDEDCTKKYSICINQECQVDHLEPTVVEMIPSNGSYAVPPLNDITLIWSETIQLIDTDRKIVIVNMDPNLDLKWEVVMHSPSSYTTAETGSQIEILQGYKLHIVPDISMSTFPEGKYLVAYEGGIVSDMAKNFNTGALNLQFTVSKNAGCPFLAVTGFSTVGSNPNGLYLSIQPMNGHAAWIRFRSPEILYIYWQPNPSSSPPSGRWIISPEQNKQHILAYANNTLKENNNDLSTLRPQGPHWMKFEMNKIVDLHHVHFLCTSQHDTTYPKLLQVSPKNGTTSIPLENFRFRLKFSKPVTYGHWANLTVASVNQTLTLSPDVEAGLRGSSIRCFLNETVEIDLSSFPKLLPGTTYHVSASVGFVTDLFYNYWNQGGHLLTFTTYGVSCSPFPSLGDGYRVTPNGTFRNGDYVQVSCGEGYSGLNVTSSHEVSETDPGGEEEEEESSSLNGDRQSSQRVYCVDGRWEKLTLQCLADCDTYQGLSLEYRVLSKDVPLSPKYPHGTALRVECSKSAVTVYDEGNGTVVCEKGEWNVYSLLCRHDCGPYDSLSALYSVSYDPHVSTAQASGTLLGARRIVSCAETAVSSSSKDTAEVVCGEQGWSALDLECHIPCKSKDLSLGEGYEEVSASDPEGPFSSVESLMYVLHGHTRVVKCSRGYTARQKSQPPVTRDTGKRFSIQCQDGKWTWVEPLVCVKQCALPTLGWAYRVDFAGVLQSREEGVEDGTRLPVECESFAELVWPTSLSAGGGENPSQQAGRVQEYLVCSEGVWSEPTFSCRAPCARPEKVMGWKSYTAVLSPKGGRESLGVEVVNGTSQFEGVRHGSEASLFCSSGSEVVQGTSPENIVCDDGQWVSLESHKWGGPALLDPFLGASRGSPPRLVCQTPCGANLKDFSRYMFSGGLQVIEQLTLRPLPEGSVTHLQCQQGFSPSAGEQRSEGTLVCRDGAWTESEPLVCLEDCGTGSFSALFQRGYDLQDPSVTQVKHSHSVALKCREDFSLVVQSPTTQGGTFQASCFNGRFILPLEKCGPATCWDGIKNGDEKGIDCGSRGCPAAFQQCDPSSSLQSEEGEATPFMATLHCQDERRNADEEGVDCGGESCRSCLYCFEVPPELHQDMVWTVNEDTTWSTGPWAAKTDLGHTRAFVEGTVLYAMCPVTSDQRSSSPALGYQAFRCRGDEESGKAEWILESAQHFVLECLAPSCEDSQRNGDEEEVDCGGSCERPCPTCQDGLQNGDEQDVDCGGTRCLPCRVCSVAPLKHFPPDTLTVNMFEPNGTVRDVNALRHIAHGARGEVVCPKTAHRVGLRCRDGDWVPEVTPPPDGPSTSAYPAGGLRTILQQLPCYPSSSQKLKDLFSESLHASPLGLVKQRIFSALLSEQVFCAKPLEVSEPCCELIRKFNSIISNECGALLFGGKNSQVAAFCTGTCMKELWHLMESDETLGSGALCPKKSTLKEMIALFCSRAGVPYQGLDASPHVPATEDKNQGSLYCFASAKVALEQINKLQDIQKSLLDEACQVNSCVRSLVRYLELLAVLLPSKNHGKTASLAFRFLQERWPVLEGPKVSTRQTSNVLTTLLQNLFQLDLPVKALSDPSLVRRLLQSDEEQDTRGSRAVPHFFSTLGTQQISGKLLNFLCLKDAKGNSCGAMVKSILSNDAQEISRSIDMLNLKNTKACSSSKCFWQVMRHLGHSLYRQGLDTLDPYVTYLGVLLRMYARVSCQICPHTHQSCALTFGFNITRLSLDLHMRYSFPSVSNTESNDSSLCKCSKVLLGDGVCDLECFTPECNFDHSDCSFKNLFPSVYQELNGLISWHETCHPFSPSFHCSTQPQNCFERVTNVLNVKGCCAATRWNLWRELLVAEKRLQFFSRKTDSPEAHFHPVQLYTSHIPHQHTLSGSSQLPSVLDRSSSWIETVCQVSLNPSCAPGIYHSQIHVEFTLSYIKYDPLFLSSEYRPWVNQLVHLLRQAVSDLLGLPLYDVTQLRFWPWHIQVQAVVDPGVVYGEVYEDLKKEKADGQLNKVLNDAVFNFLLFMRHTSPQLLGLIFRNESHATNMTGYRLLESLPPHDQLPRDVVQNIKISTVPVKDNLILSEPSQTIPEAGTLDMNNLADRLVAPGCTTLPNLSLPTEMRDSLMSTPLQHLYTMKVHPPLLPPRHVSTFQGVMPHRTTLQVSCTAGYNISLNHSGKSPQTLVCDRGRWITTIPEEPFLVCRKPCEPYENGDTGFDPLTMTRRFHGEPLDGATQLLECVTGYVPLDGTRSPELLTCRHGVWDRRSLDCGRHENLGVINLFENKTCGSTSLAQVLNFSQTFFIRELVAKETLLANLILPSLASPYDLPTHLQLWSLSCTRGYHANFSSLQSLWLACVNETLLVAPPTISRHWPTPLLPPDATDPAYLPQHTYGQMYKKIALDFYRLFQLAQQQNHSLHHLPLQRLDPTTPLQLLTCVPDIKAAVWKSSASTRLSDAVFYSLLLLGAFLFILLVILAYYLKRTRCMKQPFLDLTPHPPSSTHHSIQHHQTNSSFIETTPSHSENATLTEPLSSTESQPAPPVHGLSQPSTLHTLSLHPNTRPTHPPPHFFPAHPSQHYSSQDTLLSHVSPSSPLHLPTLAQGASSKPRKSLKRSRDIQSITHSGVEKTTYHDNHLLPPPHQHSHTSPPQRFSTTPIVQRRRDPTMLQRPSDTHSTFYSVSDHCSITQRTSLD